MTTRMAGGDALRAAGSSAPGAPPPDARAARAPAVISLPELLRRFRRAWVPPGPALARVAPPVDVSLRLRTEVQPVLDAIGRMQQRAAATRADAETKSAALLDAAQREAAEAIRKAESEAPAARTAAAERARHAVEGEIASALQAAQTEATRIETASRQRTPALVQTIQHCVLHEGEPAS